MRIIKSVATVGKNPSVWLWMVQVLLAALFLFAGGFKLVASIEMMKGPIELPWAFLRFIGAAEVAGALGLILPGLFRIRPVLTPVAACGLIIIMIGATTLSSMIGGIGMASFPFVVGLLATFVAYGRFRLAPQQARRSASARLVLQPTA
jgi:hypothetical protein